MITNSSPIIEDATGSSPDQESRGPSTAPSRPRHPMEALLKSGFPAPAFKVGDIIEGTVIEKRGTRLFIDMGNFLTGVVYGREYYAAQDIIKTLHAGDHITTKIVECDNLDGYIELSLQEAGREKRWFDLKRMMQEGTILDVLAAKANSGGLILEYMGMEGFLPTSQLSAKNYPRVEGGDKEKIFQELQKLVGQTLRVKILDLDAYDRKLIFTEKGLDTDKLRVALGRYKIGDITDGEVTGVVDFGAFVKFDEAGLEGLVHLSEIDWALIEDPRQVMKVGDRVRVKIIDIQGEKISLSLKQLKEDPWSRVAASYHKGDTVRGKVSKFNPFGAFVQLDADIQGLVHISEFGNEQKMHEQLELGQEYPFKILFLDPHEHRMSLGFESSQEAHLAAANLATNADQTHSATQDTANVDAQPTTNSAS